MNFGTRREPPGKSPATYSRQPLRILVVDIRAPHWSHTCRQICEALENILVLAGSLAGPPRIPLLSMYVAQSQPECLLPFVPVKGSFARLQRALVDLRALPTEGVLQPKDDAVTQAVKDGLQQFKQFARQSTAGSSLHTSSVEITVLTGRVGTEVARQLETRLQGVDLVSLHQLQVVVIGKDPLQDPSDAEWLGRARGEAGGTEDSMLLGTAAIDLQTVENDLLALETFFKGWLHDCGADREHLHILLPPCAAGTSPVCVKCDVQERLLSPALLPATCTGSNLGSTGDATGPFWMAVGPSLAPRKLRVVRVLKAEGLCASVLFGLPLVAQPTSCWQLNWDELEANQQSFQALCRCLWRRQWALLAQWEPQETGPGWAPPANSYHVLLPCDSASLLLQPIATRELLLPCSFSLLNDDLPEATLRRTESALEGLPVEAAYNPLGVRSHLYGVLKRSLGRPLASRVQHATERHLPRQQSRWQRQSKTKATVAPLRMAPPPAGLRSPPLCSQEEDDFLDSP